MHMPLRPLAWRSLRSLALSSPLLLGLGSRASAQSDYATPYAFNLLAGGSGPGSTDGTGTGAHFNHPYGVALDSSGVLVVADDGNSTIRQVSTAGAVTTLAGSPGLTGDTNDTGSDARFNQPTGVAVGSGGDVYVADSVNNVIRKVTSAGVVTTLAGLAGTAGSTDGTGNGAEFSRPMSLTIDGSGNVYVTDTFNDTIRKVTQQGVVTTLAGTAGSAGNTDGDGSSARFNQPIGIAIDSGGNLYVADTNNNTIRKVTSAGAVTTLAGSAGVTGSTDGTGSLALFNAPRGVAVDGSGNVYVSDSGNSTVRKVSPSGVVTTLAGTPGSYANADGTGAAALFDVPVGIAVDASGNLYVAEELGDIITKGSAAAVSSTSAPVITGQPASQTIASGSTVVLKVGATGLPAPTYQWYFGGTALPAGGAVSGATGPTLVISGAQAANQGGYYCVVSNASGAVQSETALLTVAATANAGRLINISCRSQVGTGAAILIAGFAVGGSGTAGSEPLLVRASGPALIPLGVTGTLPDPRLQLFTGSTLLGADSGWGGSSLIAGTAASVGAFPWTNPSSADSALDESLSGGPYTAQVSGASGDTGVALVEVYDATPAGTYLPTSPRLVNISARTQVGTGANVLIAGFVVGGASSKTVLIRASGPALTPFGVNGVLPDPELKLYSGSTQLASDTAWGGDPEIASAAASVGAFAWTSATSTDSALLITLPPGGYTAQVSGASGDTGVALIEVYEVP
jgi:sugar lactone lactonase YvrE